MLNAFDTDRCVIVGFQADIRRRHHIFAHLPVFQFTDCRRSADRQFIKAFQAMHDHHAPTAQPLQHARLDADQIGVEHAHDLLFCARRIGQRPEDVEYGFDAKLAAHRRGMFHRTVVVGRKHETDAGGGNRLRHGLRFQVDVHPEQFQHIGAAGFARDRTAAVFGDFGARCRGDKHRRRRHIEGMRGIAAGAAGIDQLWRIRHRHRGGKLAHHRGRGGDFTDGFLFDAQTGNDCSNQHRRHLAAHDLPHQRQHLVVKNLAMFNDARQRFLRLHQRFSSRKFFSIWWPCSVRIDSGWNCTPSTASVLWRTPMISPSSVQAVTARQSGRLLRSITSEW